MIGAPREVRKRQYKERLPREAFLREAESVHRFVQLPTNSILLT